MCLTVDRRIFLEDPKFTVGWKVMFRMIGGDVCVFQSYYHEQALWKPGEEKYANPTFEEVFGSRDLPPEIGPGVIHSYFYRGDAETVAHEYSGSWCPFVVKVRLLDPVVIGWDMAHRLCFGSKGAVIESWYRV